MPALILAFLILTSIFSQASSSEFQWKHRFQTAQSGDFIVTEQDDTYSLLFIREIDSTYLYLEEVAIPSSLIDRKKTKWIQWIKNKAPGHTSWTLYTINLKSGDLVESFSYSKNGQLYIDHSQQFLTTLLSLPLEMVLPHDRKKIGPTPRETNLDTRANWNPPLIINGKKQIKASFNTWKGYWPKDLTPMSGCQLELYFSTEHTLFAFPYWIEIKSPHYIFKMRAIDSGTAMSSPYPKQQPKQHF